MSSAPQAPSADVLSAFGMHMPWQAEPIAAGHINRTWKISHADDTAVLQWINGHVFPDPARLAENTFAVSEHVRARAPLVPAQRRTRDGDAYARDAHADVWRLTDYVPGTRNLTTLSRRTEADAAGAAFARFLTLTADFDVREFVPAIAGFHDLRPRLAAFDLAVRRDRCTRVGAATDVLVAIEQHRHALSSLPFATLPQRLIHADCKISNLLFAADRDVALAVIDLDTVMPATPLLDFADLVRSACATAPEDETDTARVDVNETWFAAIAHGFLGALAPTPRQDELALMVPACAYIAFMLGVRFATDFIDGDRYFNTTRACQNLDRARAQLRLAELFAQRERRLSGLLRDSLPRSSM